MRMSSEQLYIKASKQEEKLQVQSQEQIKKTINRHHHTTLNKHLCNASNSTHLALESMLRLPNVKWNVQVRKRGIHLGWATQLSGKVNLASFFFNTRVTGSIHSLESRSPSVDCYNGMGVIYLFRKQWQLQIKTKKLALLHCTIAGVFREGLQA